MRLKTPLLYLLCTLSCFSVFASSLSDYEKALTSYNERQYDEAFIHLKNSLQQDPNNLAAKILMGQILLINGYLSAAEVEFYEALQQGADINIIAEPLGNALLFQNKYSEILALNYTDKLVNEQKVKWLQIRASACLRLKDYDCAKKAYNESLAISPKHLMSLNGLASLSLFKQDLTSAQSYLNKAMTISAEDATTWRLLGQVAQAQGNADLAIDHFQQSLKLKKDDPITLRKLADLYLENNDFDGARAFVNEIIEQTPNDPLAILLSSWLESKDKSKLISNERLNRLNDIMSSLAPEAISARPELLYISGLTAFFHGNLEQASNNFAKYLLNTPNDMQAVMLLARTYLLTQQDKKALILLEKHQDKLVENIDSALMLGELFIKLNRAFKAQNLVEALEKNYADNQGLQLFKIKLMMVRGKQAEALDILDANLDKNKSNPVFLFTYSMLKLQAGKELEALKGAETLLALYPDETSFLNLKAGILIRLKKYDEAVIIIEKALVIDPKLFTAKFNLASIYSRKTSYKESNEIIENLLVISPKHPQVLLLKAHNLALQNELEKAIAIYNDVIILNPRNEFAKGQLAKLHLSLGNYDDALYQLDRLLVENFNNPDYLLQKAQILLYLQQHSEVEKTLLMVKRFTDLPADSYVLMSQLQRGISDFAGAIESLTLAENLEPKNSYITLDKVKLLISTSQYKAAAKIINSIESASLSNPNFWLVKALYANALKSETNAIGYLKTALELNPNFHQALVILYEMTLNGNSEADFVAEAQKIIKANPSNILAKNLMAQFFFIQQNFSQASTIYLQLLESENVINRAEIYNKLAVMILEDDLQQGLIYIKQAFALNENDARILDTYGWILGLQGKYEEGLGLLRRAFARDSNNPEIRYHLGFTLIKLARLDEARKELTMAIEVDRPFYNRAKAKSLLDSISQ